MTDHDDLEDVELDYLRNQALSSRQNPVVFKSHRSVPVPHNPEINFDSEIFQPTMAPNRSEPSRQRKSQPEVSMETFNKKIARPVNTSNRSRKQTPSSSSRSRSSSNSSYSSQYSHSYSSSPSGSHSRSSSCSASSKSSTSQSTYSSASNHSPITSSRRRSRSPVYRYRHHHQQHSRGHRGGRSMSPPPPPSHHSRSRYDIHSEPRRHLRHSDRATAYSSRYSEHRSRGVRGHDVPPSPYSLSKSRNRHSTAMARSRDHSPPPHRYKVRHPSSPPTRPHPHRRSSPSWRSPPPRHHSPPPPSVHRTPSKRIPRSPPPPPYRNLLDRKRREPPSDVMHPPRPSRRRHSLSPPPPRPIRRHRSMSPPPVRRRSPPPPPPPPPLPRRSIGLSPRSPPPPHPRKVRELDRSSSSRRLVRKDRRDEWEQHPPRRDRGDVPPPPRRYSSERRERDRRPSSRREHQEALEQWRKRKREEQNIRNGENPKKISRKMSASDDADSKPVKFIEDQEEDSMRSSHSRSSSHNSSSGSAVDSSGMLGGGGGGGIDALDEELDYDESMDDIEQYLQEDVDSATLKSEVVLRKASRVNSESSPQRETGNDASGDESMNHSDIESDVRNKSEINVAKCSASAATDHTDTTTGDLKDEGAGHDMRDGDDEEEEGQLIEENELSTEEGEVLLQTSEEDDDDDENKKKKGSSDEESDTEELNQRISSPIRLTPERRDSTGGRNNRRRQGQASGGISRVRDGRRRDDDTKQRLPVRDRLYISKTDIKRKTESINYRQHHKLSSNLASRLGPPSNRPKQSSSLSEQIGDKMDGSSLKGDARAIAEAYRKKRQKNDVPKHSDQEMQREKRRISKLLLNDNYDKGSRRSGSRNAKSDEVDLDQKISKIRREDQKRLQRQEEIRKDRQRYG